MLQKKCRIQMVPGTILLIRWKVPLVPGMKTLQISAILKIWKDMVHGKTLEKTLYRKSVLKMILEHLK